MVSIVTRAYAFLCSEKPMRPFEKGGCAPPQMKITPPHVEAASRAFQDARYNISIKIGSELGVLALARVPAQLESRGRIAELAAFDDADLEIARADPLEDRGGAADHGPKEGFVDLGRIQKMKTRMTRTDALGLEPDAAVEGLDKSRRIAHAKIGAEDARDITVDAAKIARHGLFSKLLGQRVNFGECGHGGGDHLVWELNRIPSGG